MPSLPYDGKWREAFPGGGRPAAKTNGETKSGEAKVDASATKTPAAHEPTK